GAVPRPPSEARAAPYAPRADARRNGAAARAVQSPPPASRARSRARGRAGCRARRRLFATAFSFRESTSPGKRQEARCSGRAWGDEKLRRPLRGDDERKETADPRGDEGQER